MGRFWREYWIITGLGLVLVGIAFCLGRLLEPIEGVSAAQMAFRLIGYAIVVFFGSLVVAWARLTADRGRGAAEDSHPSEIGKPEEARENIRPAFPISISGVHSRPVSLPAPCTPKLHDRPTVLAKLGSKLD